MTVQLNDIGQVARYQGFFQTSMYAPYNMNPQGYKVACGSPGSGGDPDWGESYAYAIRARDSAGLKSANYGTAICPAYTHRSANAAIHEDPIKSRAVLPDRITRFAAGWGPAANSFYSSSFSRRYFRSNRDTYPITRSACGSRIPKYFIHR